MEKVFKKLTLVLLFVCALSLNMAMANSSAPEANQTVVVGEDGSQATIPNHEVIRRADPYGVGLAVTSMTVVFSSLFMLYVIFRAIGAVMVYSEKKRKKVALESHASEPAADQKDVFSGEIAAAIALAIQMYENDLHDKESTVLTINRVAKAYSPWNSKIHGLRQHPELRK